VALSYPSKVTVFPGP